MLRLVLSLTIGGALLASTLEGQEPPVARSVKIQEGYPADVILQLAKRNTALQHGLTSLTTQQVQSVITNSRLWVAKDNPITVAFLGGTPELRNQIMAAVKPWEQASAVRFDFGPSASQGIFREWSRSDNAYTADVRIAFDGVGYWSFVGTESIDPTVAKPNQPSMNFQGFLTELPSDWQGTVLHEFGHALGLQHEHQSPKADCNSEFHWNDDAGYVSTQDQYGSFVPDAQGRRPGIYTVLEGPPNSWLANQIDFNLKQLPNPSNFTSSTFDPKSIMMYSFPGWMFLNGTSSPCCIAENLTISAQDSVAALAIFPRDVNASRGALLNVRQSLQSLTKRSMGIPGELKTQYKSRLADISR